MAALNAYRCRGGTGGFDNPYLAAQLVDLTGERDVAWPSALQPSSRPLYTGLQRNSPVSANGRAISAFGARSYSDDFYHRVHLSPNELALGNVASSQVATVRVWNAHLTAVPVLGVECDDDGVEVTPPAGLPFLMGALQEIDWLVNVTPDGPSTIDTLVTWLLATGSASLHITGSRIVPWAFAPDWGTAITERLEWRTDVLSNAQGAEQRRALRISPRRSFDTSVLVEGNERALFDLALAGWGRRVWAIPVWYDVQELATDLVAGSMRINCTAALLDFRAGGLAMLCGETAFDSEAVEILAIDANGLQLKRATQRLWGAGTRLYPVRTARIASIDSKRLTDKLNRAQLTFDLAEASEWSVALPAAAYRGRPVFELRPDETEDLSINYERLLQTLDNGSALPAVTDTAGKNFSLQQHRWHLAGRQERSAWRSLAYGLRGRAKSVWVPTHAWDLTLTKPASGALLTVERIGYSRFGLKVQGRQDIRIELNSGLVIYRRITAAAEDSGSEVLGLDADLPGVIAPADVYRISFMALCRAADDALELTHLSDADGGIAQASITWRGLRDDLETA